jgi:hypothetical protein
MLNLFKSLNKELNEEKPVVDKNKRKLISRESALSINLLQSMINSNFESDDLLQEMENSFEESPE